MQRINLLPVEYKLKRQREFGFTMLMALWAFIFLVVLCFILIVAKMEDNTIERLARYNEAKADYGEATVVADVLGELLSRNNELKEVIEQLKVKKTVNITDVSVLRGLIPEKISIFKLEVESDTIIIDGSAPNAIIISDLYNNLDESELFSQIIINSIVKASGAIVFSINADINEGL